MKIGGVCSGVGMLERAVQNTYGGEVVWHSELDAHASKVLAARSDAPNLGDLTTVPWVDVEPVDVFCAGFPCQDISQAGKRAGVNHGKKSGLWWSIVDGPLTRMRPPVVVFENVSAIVNGRDEVDDGGSDQGERGVVEPADLPAGRTWLGAVLGALADLGYVGRYGVVRAADAGAPHLRARWFCIATQQGRTVPPVLPRNLLPERLIGHLLPTPTALQAGGNPDAFLSRKEAAGIGPLLTDLGMVVEHLLPTPTARDWKDTGDLSQVPENSLLPRVVHNASTFARWAPAVARWEPVIGRCAPTPKVPRNKLSHHFVEWMMGWPEGWVCDVPDVSRNQALKLCGNGVVPQQAELALRLLSS